MTMHQENGPTQENPYSPPCASIGNLVVKRSGSLLRILVLAGCTILGTLCGWCAGAALFGHPAFIGLGGLFNLVWLVLMIAGGAFGARIAISDSNQPQKT